MCWSSKDLLSISTYITISQEANNLAYNCRLYSFFYIFQSYNTHTHTVAELLENIYIWQTDIKVMGKNI